MLATDKKRQREEISHPSFHLSSVPSPVSHLPSSRLPSSVWSRLVPYASDCPVCRVPSGPVFPSPVRPYPIHTPTQKIMCTTRCCYLCSVPDHLIIGWLGVWLRSSLSSINVHDCVLRNIGLSSRDTQSPVGSYPQQLRRLASATVSTYRLWQSSPQSVVRLFPKVTLPYKSAFSDAPALPVRTVSVADTMSDDGGGDDAGCACTLASRVNTALTWQCATVSPRVSQVVR
jgi:hypothetical protein